MKQGSIVLGLPRSGTSLVADLVYRWGAYAGSKQELLKADKWNPQAYWEYIPLKRLNDELLSAVRASERVLLSPGWAKNDTQEIEQHRQAKVLVCSFRPAG